MPSDDGDEVAREASRGHTSTSRVAIFINLGGVRNLTATA
jgi:hypothetical protein